jgi:GTP cyclohydrolase I
MTGPALPDIQDSHDDRGIRLDRVGITSVRYPTTLDDGILTQAGIAEFDITVSLPANRRGTHMSRMAELLEEELATLDPAALPRVLKSAQARLSADDVTVVARMPIATEVLAPISGKLGRQVHDVTIEGRLAPNGIAVLTTVTTDVTSLCPCSKAISDYGAHNQRSRVTVTARGYDDDVYPVSIPDLISLVVSSGSCAVYPIVKRSDERHITMAAFDNPVFVEDIVRSVSANLRARDVAHRVEATNIESIHSHNAHAWVAWDPA